jgi:hypothetical protein
MILISIASPGSTWNILPFHELQKVQPSHPVCVSPSSLLLKEYFMTVNSSLPYEKPTLVKTIAILTLINGIVNVFWGLAATATVLSTIVLACLAGFAILPTILGVFEIIYAAKLLAEPMQPIRPSQSIAIFEILCLLTFNVFSMIVGILSLVFYNDPQVVNYFTRLNEEGPQAPVPASLPEPPAAPKSPDPVPPVTPAKNTAPKIPDIPEDKKPLRRKVANNEAGPAPKEQKPKQARKSGSSSS